MNTLRRWPLAVLYALDIVLSALTGGAKDQTISARLGEAVRKGSARAAPFARVVDWGARILGEADHFAKSDEAYRARGNAAPFEG